LKPGALAATSGFDEVTKSGHLSTNYLSLVIFCLPTYLGLAPSDEHRLVIHDSIAGDMWCGNGDGFRYALRKCRKFSRARSPGNRAPAMSATKEEHVKCIVHPIPNDFRITDPARVAIVLSQGRLSLK
jgi:hypothetical protein